MWRLIWISAGAVFVEGQSTASAPSFDKVLNDNDFIKASLCWEYPGMSAGLCCSPYDGVGQAFCFDEHFTYERCCSADVLSVTGLNETTMQNYHVVKSNNYTTHAQFHEETKLENELLDWEDERGVVPGLFPPFRVGMGLREDAIRLSNLSDEECFPEGSLGKDICCGGNEAFYVNDCFEITEGRTYDNCCRHDPLALPPVPAEQLLPLCPPPPELQCAPTWQCDLDDDEIQENVKTFKSSVWMLMNLYGMNPFVPHRKVTQRATRTLETMRTIWCVRRHSHCYSHEEKRRICNNLMQHDFPELRDVHEFCFNIFEDTWPLFDVWWRFALKNFMRRYGPSEHFQFLTGAHGKQNFTLLFTDPLNRSYSHFFNHVPLPFTPPIGAHYTLLRDDGGTGLCNPFTLPTPHYSGQSTPPSYDSSAHYTTNMDISRIFAEISGSGVILSSFLINVGAADGKCVIGTWLYDPANCLAVGGSWGGVFIEPQDDRYFPMAERFKDHPKVFTIHAAAAPESVIDLIDANIPYNIHDIDIDLLKVDIDRADCRMAAALSVLRPKVIHLEINPIFPPPFGVAPEYRDGEDWTNAKYFPKDNTCFSNFFGCSLAASAALLPEYTLLQVTASISILFQMPTRAQNKPIQTFCNFEHYENVLKVLMLMI